MVLFASCIQRVDGAISGHLHPQSPVSRQTLELDWKVHDAQPLVWQLSIALGEKAKITGCFVSSTPVNCDLTFIPCWVPAQDLA